MIAPPPSANCSFGWLLINSRSWAGFLLNRARRRGCVALAFWSCLGLASAQGQGSDWTGTDLGLSHLPGLHQTNSSGGLVIAGSGAAVALRGGDQAHFFWTQKDGDFDLVVRVESLVAPDLFGRAGLVARDTLEAGSPFAGVFATPNVGGTVFQCREASGGAGRQSGAAFANYPFAWLRLRRSGNLFTGAASGDGEVWTRLDNVSLGVSSSLYVGLMVTSWRTNELATAVFRDLGSAAGEILASTTPPVELPGPCSRRTGLVISEIMYHPPSRSDGRDLEFVELFNAQSVFQDISGYQLAGALDFTFPQGTVLPAGGFLVVAHTPADIQSVYGITNVLGGYARPLNRTSGVVELRSRIGAVLLEANYDSQPPWPASADGTGHSLVLTRPSFGERNVQAWSASRWKGGSPGHWDGYLRDPYSSLVLNEVRAHSRTPDLDYVELYNHGKETIDLSGLWLSDSPATNKFRIPNGAQLEGGAFVAFDENVLGFALHAKGDTVYLTTPDQSRVIDAVRFGAQALGVALGRAPDGAGCWRPLSSPTPGARNAAAQPSDIVLNEIMDHPISANNDDQYVELFNRGASPISLAGWEFTSGIRFTFPSSASIGPGEYLVVARNAARLRTNYSNLTPQNCLGDFQGSLSHQGERLTLARPEVANPTETNWVMVTEVSYGTGGRWGLWADGGGSSLELIDPHADLTLAANWADSDETSKGQWTTIEHTGVLDLGNSAYGPNQVQILLEGAGECRVDNVEVIGPGGTNMLANGDFENGLSGWTPQGSHGRSSVESGTGINGSQCLHVRAESRGDTGANRIRGVLPNGLHEGDTVTLRARVRWLCGFPEVLIRLRGNYLEACGRMDTSSSLGTPGLPNSRLCSNAPPAIYEVGHSPVLPAADQPVVITARASDPDGLAAFVLRFRIDPATNLTEVVMRDDGTSGDLVAGDGLYTAMIPGQPAGTTVAFHLAATDGSSTPASATFPATAPQQECLVRFGDPQPGGSFGTYRLWMTQDVINRWRSREKLHNGPLDVTFVLGNQRAIYNAGALYAGSPFVSVDYSGPTGALCGYVVRFPADDLFLGITDLKLDWPVRDSSLQMEQMAYWVAEQMGIPSNRRRFVQLYVNGTHRGSIYEDAQQPNSDMVAQYFPDDQDGALYKIDDWFEFDNAASSQFVNTDATLQNFTTTGGAKKTARYRWNWRRHAVQNSANDYEDLFALVDATQMHDYLQYPTTVNALMDSEEYLRVIALEHLVGNWDSFGYYRGKNMFTYKPSHGRWNLLTWDIDFVLSAQGYPTDSGVFDTIDPTISQLFSHPWFERLYYRAFQDAVNGPLQASRFGPVLAASYNALLANGVAASSPALGSNYLTGRLRYLNQQLARLDAPFALNVTNSSSSTFENPLPLQGTAPIAVREIQVNGVAYPITWYDLTNWEVRVPLSAATNHLAIAALDSQGKVVGDGPAEVDVAYLGTLESPVGHLLFNEVMHHPAVPGAEYVELLNTSASFTFDLSGWQLSGLDYTFPPGTFITPGSFIVLTKDRTAFYRAYGSDLNPTDEFTGNLSPEGETLRLIQPGATPAQDTIVAELTYGATPPWPAVANQGGVSLQLCDPSQGQNRVGNWAARLPDTAAEWHFASVTGQATSSHLLLYLSALPPMRDPSSIEGVWAMSLGGGPADYRIELSPSADGGWVAEFSYDFQGQEQRFPLSQVGLTNNLLTFGFSSDTPEFRFTVSADGMSMAGRYQPPGQQSIAASLKRYNPGGDVYLDDVCLNKGTAAEPSANLLVNGGFEAPLTDGWILSSNVAHSTLTNTTKHSGASSLHLVAASGGVQETNALWQESASVEAGQVYTLSYWWRRGTDATALVARLGDWSLVSTCDLKPVKEQPVAYTPGRTNSTLTSFPEIPLLWLNELQAVNQTGPVTLSGQRSPWVELVNAGTNAVALSNFFLADTYTNLAGWSFPSAGVLEPGEFRLVWLDADSAQTSGSEWHANFRANPENGSLVLSRQIGQDLQVIDYLDYVQLPPDCSFGWPQDTLAAQRLVFAQPTPQRSNAAAPHLPVCINEWMAANSSAVQDPNTGRYDDWFELFNPGSEPTDLSGYLLSDTVTNPAKFVIPAGTIVPAQGYLMVWASGESQLNSPGGTLHVNFKLAAEGELILLSSPGGTPVDLVNFGPQIANVSEGPWPDGATGSFRRLTRPSPGARNIWSPELRLEQVQINADGQLTFSWSSSPGQQFRVQFKEELGDSAWTDAGPVLTASGGESGAALSVPEGGPHRFYRVVLLE
jgi:hypothetical protein